MRKTNKYRFIYFCTILCLLSSNLLAQTDKYTEDKNIFDAIVSGEKRIAQENVTFVLASASKSWDSMPDTDYLLRAVYRYELLKGEETRLKPLMLKNMNRDYRSRKVLLLFKNTEKVMKQLNALCKQDSVEVRAKLGDKKAYLEIETNINNILNAKVFKFDLYDQYVVKLIYIDTKESHKILAQLLSSDKVVSWFCNENRVQMYSVFDITLLYMRGQYRDMSLMNLEEDMEVNTGRTRTYMIQKIFREKVERALRKHYDMKVTITAPYLERNMDCE